MQDDIQLTPSPEAPDANSVQPDTNAASSDSDSGGDRIFDITDDLNISPAKDVAVRTFPSKTPKPVTPLVPKPATPSVQPHAPYIPNIQNIPIENTPSEPIPPLQPRKPLEIPLSNFSASLEKAKTIGSANPSFADFGKVTKLPMEIGKDPVAQNPNLKPLRTYEGDVAEVLAHTKASTASIAIAEAKKQQGEEQLGNNKEPAESSHAGKKLVLALISLLLIGGGLVGAYYLYSKSPLAAVTPQAPATQTSTSLIPADTQEALLINGLNPLLTLSQIKNELAKPGNPDSITEIIPIQSANGVSTRLSARDMLDYMEITPPDVLTRSLNQNWMLGIYEDTNGSRSAFVVVSTNFFQNAFTGMLQWESVMADDLKQYIVPTGTGGIANTPESSVNLTTQTNSSMIPGAATSSTTLATSTKTIASTSPVITAPVLTSTPYSIQGHFVDRIIMNKDVRAFQTYDGRTLFLYSFIDNTRLVVAANEATLTEILNRLEKEAFVR